jgi:hypothetical protein
VADEGSSEPSRRHSSPERERRPGGGGAVSRSADHDGSRPGDNIFASRGRANRRAQVAGGIATGPQPDPRRDACKLGQT